jgi:hypothetical protein
MTEREQWEMLQMRWAQGERLSPAEEQQRLAFAAHDVLARRELEMFAALRARVAGEGEPVSEELINGVLEAVAASPKLRLVGGVAATRRPRLRGALPERLRLWSLVAAGLALAVASAAALLGRSRGPTTPLVAAAPATKVQSGARQMAPELAHSELVLSAGEVLVDGRAPRLEHRALSVGQVLATGVGRACFTIDPAIDVCLAEHSQVHLESVVASSIRVRVETGLALASLSRRNAGSTFALLAGDVSALAHGTIFAARHDGDEAEIIVVEGSVAVSRSTGRSEELGAHSRVVVDSTGNVSERSNVDQAAAEHLLTLRAANGIRLHAAFGVLELESRAPSAARASIDGGPVLPLPLQSVIGVGRHRVTWRDAGDHEQESWTDVSAGETRRLEAPLGRALAVTSAAVADRPTPAALLEAARSEVGHGNRRAALGLYERLRSFYPTSPEAHTVLPTIGRLYLDLGDANRALRNFDAYLSNPGALAPEALSGKIRALRGLGQHSAEREAIQRYLARYPRGLEAPRFEKRLAELDRR